MPANTLPFSTIIQIPQGTPANQWVKIFSTLDFPAIQPEVVGWSVVFFQLTVVANLSGFPYFDYVPSDLSLDSMTLQEEYQSAWVDASGLEFEIGQGRGTASRRFRSKLVNQGLEIETDLVPSLSTFSTWQIPTNLDLWIRLLQPLSAPSTLSVICEGEIKELVDSQIVLNLTTSGDSASLSLGNQTVIIQ